MAGNVENRQPQLCGGVKPSSNATSGVLGKNLNELEQSCHSELVSESKKNITNLFKTAKRVLAFTLAETLIVMGIIGVVAALTIPNLNSSTADKEKVAKLKKIYQNLNDAVGRSAAVYGPIDDFINSSDFTVLGDRLTEFMKISKNCGASTNQGCFSNGKDIYNYRGEEGGVSENNDLTNKSYKFILADGTSVAMTGYYAIYFIVNLDGPTKAPILGKNNFVLFYDNDGNNFKDEVVTRLTANNEEDKELLDSCLNDAVYCADWVIRNENLDYLKTDENGKCPNGKVLNYTTNTSCK